MKYQVKAGTTSKICRVFVQDSTLSSGAGLTGLVYNSSGLSAYFIKEGDTSATAISLVTATVGTWTSGGFKEIDSVNFPGLYELHLVNAALANGKSVVVMLKGAANMAPVLAEIELTAVDNQSANNFIAGVNGASVSTLTQAQVSGYAGPILTDNVTGQIRIPLILDTGTSNGFASAAQFRLKANCSFSGQFKQCVLAITGGAGAGQARIISGSSSGSDTIFIDDNWLNAPDATSTYVVLANHAPLAPAGAAYATDSSANPLATLANQTTILSDLVGLATNTAAIILASAAPGTNVAGTAGYAIGNGVDGPATATYTLQKDNQNISLGFAMIQAPDFVVSSTDILEDWRNDPTKFFQNAACTIPVVIQGDPVLGWVGSVHGLKAVSSTSIGYYHPTGLNGKPCIIKTSSGQLRCAGVTLSAWEKNLTVVTTTQKNASGFQIHFGMGPATSAGFYIGAGLVAAAYVINTSASGSTQAYVNGGPDLLEPITIFYSCNANQFGDTAFTSTRRGQSMLNNATIPDELFARTTNGNSGVGNGYDLVIGSAPDGGAPFTGALGSVTVVKRAVDLTEARSFIDWHQNAANIGQQPTIVAIGPSEWTGRAGYTYFNDHQGNSQWELLLAAMGSSNSYCLNAYGGRTTQGEMQDNKYTWFYCLPFSAGGKTIFVSEPCQNDLVNYTSATIANFYPVYDQWVSQLPPGIVVHCTSGPRTAGSPGPAAPIDDTTRAMFNAHLKATYRFVADSSADTLIGVNGANLNLGAGMYTDDYIHKTKAGSSRNVSLYIVPQIVLALAAAGANDGVVDSLSSGTVDDIAAAVLANRTGNYLVQVNHNSPTVGYFRVLDGNGAGIPNVTITGYLTSTVTSGTMGPATQIGQTVTAADGTWASAIGFAPPGSGTLNYTLIFEKPGSVNSDSATFTVDSSGNVTVP